MRFSSLVFLAVVSVIAVSITECKPLSDDVEKAPCIDCKQKNMRRKRSYRLVFTQVAPIIKYNLGCLSCSHAQYTIKFKLPILVPVNRGPDVYIGNGQSNVNNVVINGANNVYIGNGAQNTNYVSYG